MNDTKSHNGIQRRRRDRAQSSDKRVTPQERDLLWFQKIHQHGPLSSSYLHAFSRHLRRNEKRARDRLTDLFNEDRTPHGGPYLRRPDQQFRTYDARYNDLVYELTPAADAALKEQGLWSDHAPAPAGPWLHRYMVSCITASIELATLEREEVSYIPQHEILARAGAPLRYPVPFGIPGTRKTETKDLIPDALFGLAYRKDGQQAYRFFIVEADRATEPSRTATFNRKSHLRNILQYREYVGRGLYKEHLGLTAGIMVLTVTTSTQTLAKMIELAQEVSGGRGNSYMLFRTAEQFGRYFKPPKPMLEFFDGAWTRAGKTSFRIDAP